MLNCQKGKIADILRQEECKKLAKEQNANILKVGRPVVLSQKRYNLLKEHADKPGRANEEKIAAEKEQRDKLKIAAEAAAMQLRGNIQRTPEQKLAEVKKKNEEKEAKARASLSASQAIAEGIRREKIAKAELLIQKLKNGPRELRSAAIQSEMLKARDTQVEVNAIIQDSIKKQEQFDKAACEEQFSIFLGESQELIQERQQREKEYKLEMLNLIRENERVRCENKRKLIEEQRRERAQIDAEIHTQIQRERQAMEKKREMLRKNAVEAMKMAEERKKRDTMYNEVEDRLCCVYKAGRYQLDQLKSQQEKDFAEERKKQIDKNTEMLAKVQERIQSVEAERIRRDIDIMKLKFDEEEQKKREREKEAKRQRIEAHLQEMEQIRKAKERETEEKRFEVAQRFKNVEVNARFNEADRIEQQQRAKCVRAQLMAQEQERQRLERERIAKTRICENKRNEQEDNFFFKYAHSLMEDAKKEQRPLYPYRRVINNYKRDNMRELQSPKLPRHMISNVRVDCVVPATECNTANAGAGVGKTNTPITNKKSTQKTERSPMSMIKAETLEHMAKINAMLAEEDRMRAAKSAKLCKPYTCLTETKELKEAHELKNDGLQQQLPLQFEQQQQQQKSNDMETASAKLRYGIEELKLLGTPAPSLH